jgi:A/G-specific adenine glycosylase
MSRFAQRLIAWQRRHGRHDLPWQDTRDPYRVWLSEIMLQQTQVTTVIPYYERFLARFPSLDSLASAPITDVMARWSGLGYYARARNLHKCAQTLVASHGGAFPHDPAIIATLPGIGRSTANAIAVFCFGARAPILDGNVKRVLCRFLGIEGFPGDRDVGQRLWEAAAALLPRRDVATYIQAQMDLGATVCTRKRPACDACPVAKLCVALHDGRTTDLPAPRPKRSLPERAVTLLVLRHGDRVALETRPPAGIWGGLQSLPELPEGQDVLSYLRDVLRLHPGAVTPGLTFVHGFTHFRLRIHPVLCIIDRAPRRATARLHWFDRAEWAQAALPAPIRKILSGIP